MRDLVQNSRYKVIKEYDMNLEDEEKYTVRIGTIDELINLWGYNNRELSSTTQFFVEKIKSGEAIFYILACEDECIDIED